MYHLYNLISEGDLVEAETTRNVVKETNSGATTKKRMTVSEMVLITKCEMIIYGIQMCIVSCYRCD